MWLGEPRPEYSAPDWHQYIAAGVCACSFTSESLGGEAGILKAAEMCGHHENVVVIWITGSLSLLSALASGPAAQYHDIATRIWTILAAHTNLFVVGVFQFSHCDSIHNELADVYASVAASSLRCNAPDYLWRQDVARFRIRTAKNKEDAAAGEIRQ